MGLNWNCDRQDKDDFTASTIAYLQSKGYTAPVGFYEEGNAGGIVRYGDPDANLKARVDIYMVYGDRVYAIEIKGRKFNSDYPQIVASGSFYNYEKDEVLQAKKNKGYIPLFVDLYPDGVIRVWNMGKIAASGLQTVERSIKATTIDPESRKRAQKRALLPISAATEIKRIKGKRE